MLQPDQQKKREANHIYIQKTKKFNQQTSKNKQAIKLQVAAA